MNHEGGQITEISKPRDGATPVPGPILQGRYCMDGDRTMKERLEEIEDRKIEILLEIGRTNERYDETVSRLNSEYQRLDAEQFRLRMALMGNGQEVDVGRSSK